MVRKRSCPGQSVLIFEKVCNYLSKSILPAVSHCRIEKASQYRDELGKSKLSVRHYESLWLPLGGIETEAGGLPSRK